MRTVDNRRPQAAQAPRPLSEDTVMGLTLATIGLLAVGGYAVVSLIAIAITS